MAISTIGTNGLDQTNNIELGATGNVGIGTASPTQKLDVNGNIQGTSLFSTGGGSASVPSLRLVDIGTGIWHPATDTIGFSTAGSERMRIDSSGNVGIGTSSPGSTGKFVVDFVGDGSKFASFLSTSVGVQSYGAYATSHVRMTYPAVADWDLLANSGGALTISRNATERMRIDSGGRLYVNQTAGNGNTLQRMGLTYDGSSEWGLSFKNSWSGNAGSAINFNNYAGTQVGTIQPGATSTSYNTSSDYRLKENVQPMVGALNIVTQLKPVTYNWIADGSQGQGFIAHELQAVVPDCVTGEKDAVDADGNPVYQGIDTSFLVATLTAAIQEQQELIKQLQTDVAKLKGAKA